MLFRAQLSIFSIFPILRFFLSLSYNFIILIFFSFLKFFRFQACMLLDLHQPKFNSNIQKLWLDWSIQILLNKLLTHFLFFINETLIGQLLLNFDLFLNYFQLPFWKCPWQVFLNSSIYIQKKKTKSLSFKDLIMNLISCSIFYF